MRRPTRTFFLSYGLAVLSIVIASGVRLLLDPLLGDRFPFATLFFAVLVMARYGGFGPAVFATLFGAGVSEWVLLCGKPAAVPPHVNQVGLGLYLGVSVGIALLGREMQSSRLRAEAVAAVAVRQQEERRQIVADVHERERQLQLVTNNAPVYIAHCTTEKRFKFVNKPYAARFGLHPQDLVGKSFAEILGTEAAAVIDPYVERVLSGQRVEYEGEIPYRELGKLHMQCAYQPEFDSAGRVIGYVAALLNVTETKRVEQALLEEARITETLYRVGKGLAAELDLQTIVQTVTDEATVLTGAQFGAFFYNVLTDAGESYTLFTLSGVERAAFDRFPMPRNTEIFEPTFRGQEVVRLDDVTQDPRYGQNAPYQGMPDGHLPVRSYLAVPVVSHSGEVIGGLFFGHSDVGVFTDRHARLVLGIAAQAAVAVDNARLYDRVRKSEQQFRLLTDALPVLISYVDSNQRYRVINKHYETWFGHSRSEIVGKSLREVLGDAAHDTVRPFVDEALAGREVTYERLLPYRDVGSRFVRVHYVPHFDDGKVLGFFALVTDISASKRAEKHTQFLADASAVLAGLVDYESTLQKVARLAVPDFADWCAVDMIDEGDTVKRVAVVHSDPAKIEIAHDIHRRFPPDPNSPHGVWNIVRKGKPELISEISDSVLVETLKDEELVGIVRKLGLRSYLAVPLTVRGKIIGVVTFFTAESGRRYTDADLALAEDLVHRAAVAIENAQLYQEARDADRRKNEFLAVLGHELRNPLAPITSSLAILKQPAATTRTVERAREMIERQVQHMVRLVDDLLDISRIVRGKIELRREPVELAVVIRQAVETLQPLLDAERHNLVVAVPPEPLSVDGDAVRLVQVVANLLNNAARYTEPGGTIRVELERAGPNVILRVCDTGIGIASEMLPQIWDMFVQADRRLKSAQGGMGIGLALVKGLVELHGGSATAQ